MWEWLKNRYYVIVVLLIYIFSFIVAYFFYPYLEYRSDYLFWFCSTVAQGFLALIAITIIITHHYGRILDERIDKKIHDIRDKAVFKVQHPLKFENSKIVYNDMDNKIDEEIKKDYKKRLKVRGEIDSLIQISLGIIALSLGSIVLVLYLDEVYKTNTDFPAFMMIFLLVNILTQSMLNLIILTKCLYNSIRDSIFYRYY